MKETLAPYFVYLSKALCYLGIDSHRFNSEVEPKLVKVFVGDRKGFKREDLDAWARQQHS